MFSRSKAADKFLTFTIWTLVLSAINAIIYAGIFFSDFRPVFFSCVGIVAIGLSAMYLIMTKEKQQGPWNLLGNVAFMAGFTLLVLYAIVIIVGLRSTTEPSPDEKRIDHSVAFMLYFTSPFLLMLANFINTLVVLFLRFSK